jgi:hypothetical protein
MMISFEVSNVFEHVTCIADTRVIIANVLLLLLLLSSLLALSLTVL